MLHRDSVGLNDLQPSVAGDESRSKTNALKPTEQKSGTEPDSFLSPRPHSKSVEELHPVPCPYVQSAGPALSRPPQTTISEGGVTLIAHGTRRTLTAVSVAQTSSSSTCIPSMEALTSPFSTPTAMMPMQQSKETLFHSQPMDVAALRALRPTSCSVFSAEHDPASCKLLPIEQQVDGLPKPGRLPSETTDPEASQAASSRQPSVAVVPPPLLNRSSGGPAGVSATAGGHASAEQMQTFYAYLHAESHPGEKLPTADVVWGQTERDRVYNFLIFVPFQLERLIEFSFMLCTDCVLGVVTLLPLRCVLALKTIFSRMRGKSAPVLSGSQVFDLLCLLILFSATMSLRSIPPGFIYYWLKDIIVNEFLKMSVLTAVLEISERIVGNFGLDVMEALSGTCTMWAMGRRELHYVVCDAIVAFVVVLLHAVILMCEALVLAMALNSRRNGLVGLLIASNFVEIKGNVFKRWDVERIRRLVWMDVVERFQLICILVFVVVEDMDSGSTWTPSRLILGESLRILAAELVIDITKHAVLGKFTDVRPGIYREYMKDLCDKVTVSQSHNMHKQLGFHHLACCSLLLRSALTLFWLRLDSTMLQVSFRALLVVLLWVPLLLFKAGFGYALKWVAHCYSESYSNTHQVRSFARSASIAAGRTAAVGLERNSKREASVLDAAELQTQQPQVPAGQVHPVRHKMD